jgi:hypothetical protein
MPLRQVMHFRDQSQTDYGAVAAAIKYGQSEGLRNAHSDSDEAPEQAAPASASKHTSLIILALLGIIGCITVYAYSGGNIGEKTLEISRPTSVSLDVPKIQVELHRTELAPVQAPIEVRVAEPARIEAISPPQKRAAVPVHEPVVHVPAATAAVVEPLATAASTPVEATKAPVEAQKHVAVASASASPHIVSTPLASAPTNVDVPQKEESSDNFGVIGGIAVAACCVAALVFPCCFTKSKSAALELELDAKPLVSEPAIKSMEEEKLPSPVPVASEQALRHRRVPTTVSQPSYQSVLRYMNRQHILRDCAV